MVAQLVREQLSSNPEFQRNLAESVKAGGGGAVPPATVRIESEPVKVLVDALPLKSEPLKVGLELKAEPLKAEPVVVKVECDRRERSALDYPMNPFDWMSVAAFVLWGAGLMSGCAAAVWGVAALAASVIVRRG